MRPEPSSTAPPIAVPPASAEADADIVVDENARPLARKNGCPAEEARLARIESKLTEQRGCGVIMTIGDRFARFEPPLPALR